MQTAPTASPWTEDRVELLKKLWNDGLSASQIARWLGGGISRNAAIGKVHRLGLSGRVRPRVQETSERRRREARRSHTKPLSKRPLPRSPAPLPRMFAKTVDPNFLLSADQRAPDHVGKPLLELGDGDCRWPLGDPKVSGFCFCAARTTIGSYCNAHLALSLGRTVFVPIEADLALAA